MAVYHSILQLIGNTPLLRLFGVEKAYGCHAQLYGKMEFFNPAGSVKDRAAYEMICQAERQGKLKPDGVVIEATSGNMGISLAMVCRLKGYSFIAVMPENMSEERKKLLRAYGATLVLTSAQDGMSGALERCWQLSTSIENSFIPEQFSSASNTQCHYQTTGVEIYRDLPGVNALVCGVGSGGTLTGTARYLKEQKKEVHVIAVEPNNSPVLSGGVKGMHGIDGIGAGFVPKILDVQLIDETYLAEETQALEAVEKLMFLDGIFVGVSSGAALCGAIEWGKRIENKGKKIVVIFADGGGRYLSKLS